MSSMEHTFHVPILGIGFSVDTPAKVAQYGISSVASLVNDSLIEKMREYYCKVSGEKYTPISRDVEDHRALRIMEYLNLLQRIVARQIDDLRNSIGKNTNEVKKYFSMLPDGSELKNKFFVYLTEKSADIKKELEVFLKQSIVAGEICVNIMTKIDRENFRNGVKLDKEFSDAMAALRGFALSKGNASIVFSAGFNRRLYSYAENFDCFFPDADGNIEKKVILKISDYRSALTQAKFLASKGIWISEYRVESGLNCSGHVFPVEGKTIGLILEELKSKRQELMDTILPTYKEALAKKGIEINVIPEVRYTYQGGVATHAEHEFLMDYYNIDAIGWGAAFMFVPEAVNLSKPTLDKMIRATDEDLYISNASPLGVPFNTLRENINEDKMYQRYLKGEYGYNCNLGYLANNTEFTEKPICTASRKYMEMKIESLKKESLSEAQLEAAIKKVVIKYCICSDLSKSPVTHYKIEKDDEGVDVFSVCTGKTASYFNRSATLQEMVDHIYGRVDLLDKTIKRAPLFINEIKINIDYLDSLIKDNGKEAEIKNTAENIEEGIKYFEDRAADFTPLIDADEFKTMLSDMRKKLKAVYNIVC